MRSGYGEYGRYHLVSQSPKPVVKLPRCGSEDPEHRVDGCRPCKNQRQREWREKAGINHPDRVPCVMCGIAKGNSQKIPVTRYPLIRHIKKLHSNRCIGSLALCDVCVADNARPSPSYVRRHGVGFRGEEVA